MKLSFVSNYINHHQIPLSDALYEKLGDSYHFIQTEPMERERAEMGWGLGEAPPYLKCYYEEEAECRELIESSDIVVFGGVEEEGYIRGRLEAGKTVIRYSERLYREGQWKAVSPRGLVKKYRDHTRYRRGNVYLLCAGAYVASDFHIVRAYPGKMFQWGYFPKLQRYETDGLFAGKGGAAEGKTELLFAGRFLPLKHPEYALALAEALKERRLPFHLTMVGGGVLEEDLRRQAAEADLDGCVSFTGYKRPDEVRRYMERADIFLMTSDHLEGWGAVLNEAMNSGCAVLACAGIGAAPFLLRHGENGMVYQEGNRKEFLEYGLYLAEDRELRERLGRNAYALIEHLWNPQTAAERLLAFAEGLTEGELRISKEGPLSPAPILSPRRGYAYTRRTR